MNDFYIKKSIILFLLLYSTTVVGQKTLYDSVLYAKDYIATKLVYLCLEEAANTPMKQGHFNYIRSRLLNNSLYNPVSNESLLDLLKKHKYRYIHDNVYANDYKYWIDVFLPIVNSFTFDYVTDRNGASIAIINKIDSIENIKYKHKKYKALRDSLLIELHSYFTDHSFYYLNTIYNLNNKLAFDSFKLDSMKKILSDNTLFNLKLSTAYEKEKKLRISNEIKYNLADKKLKNKNNTINYLNILLLSLLCIILWLIYYKKIKAFFYNINKKYFKSITIFNNINMTKDIEDISKNNEDNKYYLNNKYNKNNFNYDESGLDDILRIIEQDRDLYQNFFMPAPDKDIFIDNLKKDVYIQGVTFFNFMYDPIKFYAEFYLIDDMTSIELVKKNCFSAACENLHLNTQGENIRKIKTEQNGIAKKMGDNWKVIEKTRIILEH